MFRNHGHGAPEDAITVECEKFTCIIKGLYFIMSGPWELIANATVNNVQDKAEFKVTVP